MSVASAESVERERARAHQYRTSRAATSGAGGGPIFRGAALEAQRITARRWIIAGPFETGKTWAALWRLDTEARENPKGQYAIVRKVRNDMDGTVLVTWKKLIAMRGGVAPFGGERVQWYDYSNGARVWIGGLDRPEKTLSGERDGIYVNQVEELEETDWEMLTRSTTGRGAVTSHPMLFGDCNPGPEDHWIIHRRDSGRLALLESKHKDNPTLYDDSGEMTEQGRATMADLDGLTGALYWRGRMGLWVGAEGQHFEAWDEAKHVIDPRPITGDWIIWGALDYGFGHPFAAGVLGLAPDGSTHLMAEFVTRKTLIPDLVAGYIAAVRSIGLSPDRVRFIAAGHDTWATRGGDDTETIADKWAKHVRAQLGHDALRLERATVDRVNGAAVIQEGLGNAQRAPTLFLWRKCTETIKAIPRMVTDPKNAEDVKKVNADANGRGGDDCFIAGTLITTARGEIPIEYITVGDMLLTRAGYRPVKAVWNSRRNADIVTATLSNGTQLVATPNHRIWTPKYAWKCIDTLRYGDIISLCQNKHQNLKQSSSMGYPFGGIPTLATPDTASITRLVASISSRVWGTFMLRYGSQPTALFLMDVISIIRTGIRSIMTLITLNALRPMNTMQSTCLMGGCVPPCHFTRMAKQKSSGLALLTGIAQMRAEHGTERISSELMQLVSQFSTLVNSAVFNLNQSSFPLLDSAQTNVNQNGGVIQDLTILKSHVSSADRCSLATSMKSFGSAPVYVLDVIDSGKADTYAIHVAGHHEYYANGVLVKNCYDMFRYGLLGRPHYLPAPRRPTVSQRG